MVYEELPLREDGTAMLCCYLLDPQISSRVRKVRPAMVICPGGGYVNVSHKEGEPVAARWLGMGYHAFVVKYKHYLLEPPVAGEDPVVDEGSHIPEQLIDLMRAMAIIRGRADEWALDASRVYALGFSAGGHIVGSLAERFDDEALLARAGTTAETVRPTAIVLGYPMLSASLLEAPDGERPAWIDAVVELAPRALFGTDEMTPEQLDSINLIAHVRPDMPRAFLWQSAQDRATRAEDTLAFALELKRAGVPFELHVYQSGPHGTSLCDGTSAASRKDVQPASAHWVEACRRWLERDAWGCESYGLS